MISTRVRREPRAARVRERRGDAAARPSRWRRPSPRGARRPAGEQTAQQDAELVGGAGDVGDDAPVRAERRRRRTGRGSSRCSRRRRSGACESARRRRGSRCGAARRCRRRRATSSSPAASMPGNDAPRRRATTARPARDVAARASARARRGEMARARAAARRSAGTRRSSASRRVRPSGAARSRRPDRRRAHVEPERRWRPSPGAAPRQRVSIRTAGELAARRRRGRSATSRRSVAGASASSASATYKPAAERQHVERATRPRALDRASSQMPAPGSDVQRRPCRSPPAVCSSARTSVPAGAPAQPRACATSSVDATDGVQIHARHAEQRASSRGRDAVVASQPSAALSGGRQGRT